jgi:hypothetical protein
MNTTHTNDIPCVFDLTGQRLTYAPTLALLFDTNAILSRTETGTVTTYLKGVLATYGTQAFVLACLAPARNRLHG